MTVVKITNGEVTLKDFVTRGVKKEMNRVLFRNAVTVTGDDGKPTFEGITMGDMSEASEIAMIGLTEKIVINDVELPISIETYDGLNDDDVELVLKEVNKTTNKETGKN